MLRKEVEKNGNQICMDFVNIRHLNRVMLQFVAVRAEHFL